MKMSVVLLGEGAVYATGRGRSFHEGPDCASMIGGQMVYMCRCGDVYCGCAGEVPMTPRRMSISTAALEGLKPCGTCYPDFQGLEIQLPADEDFGHRQIWLDGDWFCRKCRTRWIDEDGERNAYPTVWPCISARVLSLV